MEKLILRVNQLQQVCNTVGEDKIDLNLPQIVVVGSESTGKTSVLESFVGKDFLPRNEGIVTRCPLILQLVHIDENVQEPQTLANEWAVFGHHHPPRVFTDFEEVRKEIETRTDQLTGSKMNISPHPIFLKIYSSKVVTLTLVDLPGLVKIPVEGQPHDIGKQIKKMVREYIKNPNTIILAVTPADTNVATSHALSIAKDHDPEGLRTLCVLTKLDKAPVLSKAEEVLTGGVLKVKLGIVGVVNRSQDDIDSNMSIAHKKLEERQFLKETFPRLAHQHGTDVLANRLSELLAQRILEWVPMIQEKIDQGISQHKSLVESHSFPAQSNDDKVQLMLRAIDKFAAAITDDVNGRTPGLHTRQLEPGARIYELFYGTYPSKLNAVAEPRLSAEEITYAVKNARGSKPRLSIPNHVFVNLAKYYIKEIEKPSLDVAEEARKELGIIVENSRQRTDVLRMYPTLRKRMMEETEEFLKMRLQETKEKIEEHVERELNFINYSNHDFDAYFENTKSTALQRALRTVDENAQLNGIDNEEHNLQNEDGPRAVPSEAPCDTKSPGPTGHAGASVNALNDDQSTSASDANRVPKLVKRGEKKKVGNSEPDRSLDKSQKAMKPALNESELATMPQSHHIIRIEKSLKAYAMVINETASDMVIKIISYHLINKTEKDLANHIRAKLNRTELLPILLAESAEIVEQRRVAQKMLEAYENANSILSDIKAFCMQ